MPDGRGGELEYPRTADLLYAFCIDGLEDLNEMIRRLNHAERDANLPRNVAAAVRDALWNRAPKLPPAPR